MKARVTLCILLEQLKGLLDTNIPEFNWIMGLLTASNSAIFYRYTLLANRRNSSSMVLASKFLKLTPNTHLQLTVFAQYLINR